MNTSENDSCSEGEELNLSEIDIFEVPRKVTRQKEPTTYQENDRTKVALPDTGALSDAFAGRDAPSPVTHSNLKLRFEGLREEAGNLRARSAAIGRRTEQRRRSRLKRRLERYQRTEGNSCKPEGEWKGVKEFLTVNDHLAGPVPHGSCGPKSELESLVDSAIEEGDFAKAEMLSDHLADRQFAVKIADAFAAKRCAEELQAKKIREYVKRQKKLQWGFEAKEKWQMKGNM